MDYSDHIESYNSLSPTDIDMSYDDPMLIHPAPEDEIDAPLELAPIFQMEQSVLDRMAQQAVQCVSQHPNIPKESKTLLNTYILNHLINYPDSSDMDLSKELERYIHVVREETELEGQKLLPSIGVEVESSGLIFPQNEEFMMNVLEDLGYSVMLENNSTEIRLPPSHSARVQARMLLELEELGLITSDRNYFASLHVSLVVPRVNKSEEFEDLADFAACLSDVVTYAYVPPGRVRHREYESHIISVENGSEIVQIKKNVPAMTRIELRTPRVVGNDTFRMLLEIQKIGYLLRPSKSPGQMELRRKFGHEVNKIRNHYMLGFNAPDFQVDRIVGLLGESRIIRKNNALARKQDPLAPQEPNLIDDARAIMHEFSDKAYELFLEANGHPVRRGVFNSDSIQRLKNFIKR